MKYEFHWRTQGTNPLSLRFATKIKMKVLPESIASLRFLEEYQSGQLGQTVNLLAQVFVGSNPASSTNKFKAKYHE